MHLRDTCEGIFDKLYLVRVSEMLVRDIKDVTHYGTYITGYNEIDNDLPQRHITTYMSIAVMSDYYSKGAIIAIVKEKDLKSIYEAITAHLKAWSNHLEIGLNTRDAPIEDLMALDNLAEKLFAHTRHTYVKDSMLSGTLGHLSRTAKLSYDAFIKVRNNNSATIGKSTVELPTRTSHSALLKAKASEYRR